MLKYKVFGSRKELVDFVNVNKIPRQLIINVLANGSLFTLFYWEEEI